MKIKYSLISIIPENSLEKLKELQDKIFLLTWSELFRKQRPLHITVGAWNELNEGEVENVCAELQKISWTHNAFEINLGGTAYKENSNLKKIDVSFEPYVVHIWVHVNQKLKNLVDDIDNILRKYDIYFEIIPYTPHMTVAGRDLTKEGFELLQKELQTFEFNTTVLIDSFSLVLAPCKENNISTMQEIKRFQLQDNTLHSTI